MKSIHSILSLFVVALALVVVACNGDGGDDHGHEHNGDQTEHMHEGDHMHDDAAAGDHMHDDSPEGEMGMGPEYTSTYVCPMHCEGSGSEEPGKCPVCGMDYVLRTEHEANGHTHTN
ncbi:MAG: heavy metal-binding domain-containing protein [Saprospiraceae bacterium]|nr:heavy metal-binding domain-containing protein [Saprospiraceae bacterium]